MYKIKDIINKVHCADCLGFMKTLPDNSVDLVITDPPYNQSYEYDNYKDSLSEKDYLELLSVIKRPAVVIHYPEQTINLLPKILGRCDEVVSWSYETRTKKHTRLISWWGCSPDFSKVKVPYAEATLKDKRNLKKLKDGRDLKDYWHIPYVNNMNKEKTNHPCQIPLEVMERIIKITTNENDIILDPFLGSGTTAVACQNLKRNFIGIEISEKYCKIARDRLRQQTLI